MRALFLCLAFMLATAPARAAQQAEPGYRISGMVIDAVTSAPVPRAEVSLSAGTGETKTTSGDDGRFLFQGLDAGKYPIFAGAQGYIREGYNQHGAFFTGIAVGSGLDSEHVILRLHREAVITGRVTDEHGEAVRRAQVMLFGYDRASRSHATFMRAQVQTNDLGEYRFAHLQAGKYYVAVQTQPWYAQVGLSYSQEQGQPVPPSRSTAWKPDTALDVVYPITFYPGVTQEHAATELNLTASDKQEANIQLQAVPSVHVRLTNLPGNAENGINIQANQRFFGSIVVPLTAVSGQISPGEYEVAGLPPGEVTLNVSGGGNQEWRSQTIKANVSGNETLDGAGTTPIANVSGRVIFPTGEVISAQARVTLLDEGNQSASATLQKDGTFSFAPLQAGTYKVSVDAQGNNEYVENLSATGAKTKTSGREITISTAGDVQLGITMGRGMGGVTGVAKLDGKPAAGMMVLLVPASGQNLEEDSRMDQSDSDGTFALARIFPGKYLLVAIADGWDLDWSNGSDLKPYLEKAQSLQISADDQEKVAVEVQHKK